MNYRNLFTSFCCLFLMFLSIQAQTQNGAEKQFPANDAKSAPQLKTASEYRYQLVPGDVIEISYRYTPEFNQTATIQPDGYVALQIVGDIKLNGLNLEQARQEIIKKAGQRLKDPEITLILKEFQKPYFVVSGEVSQPGKFEIREKTTALQALMLAGGFKDSAKSSQILVFRKINADVAEVKMLDLKNIKKTSDLENDITLESGDIIFVPRNNFSKIEKYVRLASLASFLSPILR